jgi:hypothetical protein
MLGGDGFYQALGGMPGNLNPLRGQLAKRQAELLPVPYVHAAEPLMELTADYVGGQIGLFEERGDVKE